MEIDEKQLLNDEWYNKYSAALILASLEDLNAYHAKNKEYGQKYGFKQKYSVGASEQFKEDLAKEFLDALILYSQSPSQANISTIIDSYGWYFRTGDLSTLLVPEPAPYLEFLLEKIQGLSKAEEKDEYFYIIRLAHGKHSKLLALLHIGDNRQKNISIMRGLLYG